VRLIRLLLAEDQTLVRQGLKGLLQLAPDMEVVAEACDGEEALDLIPKVKPDVVLLDIRMPKVDGLGVLRGLSGRGVLPPTLVLTTFDEDDLLFDALRAGAKGFLLKDVTLEQLTEAIRCLASGGSLIQPALTERTRRTQAHLPHAFEKHERPEPLTERERDVLRMLAGGYSNREIATALHMAEGTVKNHASSNFAKFGVRDRTRAVLRALELGLL
jgi:DNA-binding NarL/FixJ family response regulator